MCSRRRIKRRTRGVGAGGQLNMGFVGVDTETETSKARAASAGVIFKDPDPRNLFVGEQRLEEFLQQMGFSHIFRLRELLRSLDLLTIESKYKGGGRKPYHPAAMLGIILFGIMEGRTSLRELETLGRSDVRSWWLSGGAMPTYSVLCRFINNNADVLTEEFFEQLTREVIRQTSSKSGSVAVDGTVVQAAASRYKTIKQEAAERMAAEARRAAQERPEDEQLAERAERAEWVAAEAKKRTEKRKEKKRKNSQAPVCPTEPEAVVQSLKSKAIAPGYKASVAANDDRIITGKAVHPTSETSVVPGLVEQSERSTGERVGELLEDAGYHCNALLTHALENDINLLCPQGRTDGGDESWEKISKKRYLKNRFRYDETNDVYICPAGQHLKRDHAYKGNERNPAYVQYRCAECQDCAQRTRCTNSSHRAIKRYCEDELKEAMREVMRQPGARRRYQQRQAMVEPVHGELRHIQGLSRFRRRGLAQVCLEYSLHCAAHNLRRYLRLCGKTAAALAGRYLPNLALFWLKRTQERMQSRTGFNQTRAPQDCIAPPLVLLRAASCLV